MSKREILAGATDQTIDIFIRDSSSTVGAGLTGLVFNTASLTCYYRKGATGTPTALTLATQTVGGAHSDGGFVAVDGTNCPGQYRLDLSDTIVATAGMVTLYLRGATNMVPCVVEIEVVSVNKFDSVRLGLTALPNAAAEAAGGLYTRGTGAGQINQDANGRIDANVKAVGGTAGSAGVLPSGCITSLVLATGCIDNSHIAADAIGASELAADAASEIATAVWAAVTRTLTAATNITSTGGTISISGGLVAADTQNISGSSVAADNCQSFFDGTGYAGTNNVIPTVTTVTNQLTAAQIATGVWTDTTAGDFTTALSIGKSIMNGVSLGTGLTINAYTGNTPQTGDSYAIVNSGTHGNAAIKGYVDDIGIAGAGLSAIPWNTAWDAEVQSECDDALTAYGASTLNAAGVRTAVGMSSANLDTQLAAIVADTNELQVDWTNGGRLDLLVDSILDDTGTSGVAIAAATMNGIADATLIRGVSNVQDTADTTSLAAIILAILESSVSGTTWTIRKTGGTTFVTKTITTDAAADPITGVT